MQNQKGFTIIELIVVIAIIAILAAIVVVNVTGYIATSKDAAIREDMHVLFTDATNNGPLSNQDYSTYLGSSCGSYPNWANKILPLAAGTDDSCFATASTTTSPSQFCLCVHENHKDSAGRALYYCMDSTNKITEDNNPCYFVQCVSSIFHGFSGCN